MRSWLKELDELLRGRKTKPELLAEGTSHLAADACLIAVIVLGAVYGVFMGVYSLLSRGAEGLPQLGAAAVKAPALFLLTLLVTFPSLYVFSALRGTKLSLKGMLRLVMGAVAVNVAVLGSFGPVIGFFSLTTKSYPFIKLLNVAFFAVSGVIGVGFLLKTLDALRRADSAADAGPSSAEADGADVAPDSAQPPMGPYARLAARHRQARGERKPLQVFHVWVILYALVGAQMGWILRPFIGSPDLPFAWFRPLDSNFFLNVLKTLGELLN